MRISRTLLAVAASLLLPGLAQAAGQTFASPEEALRQGISAYQGGYYEIAEPALEHAKAGDEFMAKYYLARIYADNTGSRTDHAKAYALFRELAEDYADVDPEDDSRAEYVGKAQTAVAGYLKTGLPQIGLAADIDEAVRYLNNASTTFSDEDAQFELAKLRLKGEGVETNVRSGIHYLSVLTQKGHAGAQAFLADLYWRGKYVKSDPALSLALISVAVANAPKQERLWIEDIYQNIFCGAAEGVRTQATGIVAGWGDRYGRKPAEQRVAVTVGDLDGAPARACKNGEPVDVISPAEKSLKRGEVIAGPAPAPGAASPAVMPAPQGGGTPSLLYGSAGSAPAVRDVGSSFAPGQAQ